MAQRHEIEAWVNPAAWDDQDEARRVIDAIAAAGTDDEAQWVRLAGGEGIDVALAIERDALRRDERVTRVRERAVAAVRCGALSEVKAARAAGVSRPTLRAWLGK